MYAIETKADAMLPRERLRDLGAEHLSNQELLSILLRTGTKTTPVLEVANQILKNLDSLADFQHYPCKNCNKSMVLAMLNQLKSKQ